MVAKRIALKRSTGLVIPTEIYGPITFHHRRSRQLKSFLHGRPTQAIKQGVAVEQLSSEIFPNVAMSQLQTMHTYSTHSSL